MTTTIKTLIVSLILILASFAYAEEGFLQKIITKKNKVVSEGSSESSDLNTPPVKNPFKPHLPAVVIPRETPKGGDDRSSKPENLTQPVRMQPPAEIQPPQLKISGLIWNSDRPQAIINNQIVNIGDQIENSTIKQITKTGIVIIFQKKEFTIPANP